jgi:hypothetical protein
LIESLAAILIFTMASIVMYSMVTTAADINRTAKEMDEANQQHMIAVEMGLPEAQNGSATITFSLDGTQIAQTRVDIYGGDDDSLFTYFIQTGG